MSKDATPRLSLRLSLLLCSCLALPTLLFLLFNPVRSQTLPESKLIPLVLRDWRPDTPHGHLLLTEVLYNPTGDEPQAEWVEIANFAGTVISLDGIKIGDALSAGAGEGMHAFPSGAEIQPGRAIVIAHYASTFRDRYGRFPDFELSESDPGVPNLPWYSPYANKNMSLNNAGDEVVLLDQEDRVIDLLSWGSSKSGLNPSAKAVADGHSLERFPSNQDQNRAGDWVDQPEPNPGALKLPVKPPTATPGGGNIPPSPGLLISEVLFNPAGDEPNGEWFELYNPGAAAADLSGCQIGDEETAGGPEGMLAFPAGSSLPAGGVAIVANQAKTFYAAYGYSPDFEMTDTDPSIPDMVKSSGWGTGNVHLSNTDDELLLLDAQNRPLDSISWGTSNAFLDPPAPLPPEGHSLERYPADLDTGQASDWFAQPEPDPGNVRRVGPTPIPTNTMTPTPTVTAAPSVTPTPTATIPVPPANYLLISEFIYSPTVHDTAGRGEWYEIYNPTSHTVDLSNYKIGDAQAPGDLVEGMYRFPPGSSIAPGEVILVGNTALDVLDLFRILPDYEVYGTHPHVPNLILYPEWGGGVFTLNQIADEVLLLNENDEVVDAVNYGFSTYPGAVPHPLIGSSLSLERVPPDRDTDNCVTDFIEQFYPSPGRLPDPQE